MTGTPIHNKWDDLYSLVNFLKIDIFSDYYWWNRHINKNNKENEVYDLIQNIMKPIMLRRTKNSKYTDGTPILNLP